jgi:hypothetical protein
MPKKRDQKSASKTRENYSNVAGHQFDGLSDEEPDDRLDGEGKDMIEQKRSVSCTDEEAEKGKFEKFPEISQVTVNNLKARGIKNLFPV